MVLMTPDDSIFVAGHRGMVGGAICRALSAAGHGNLLTRTRSQLDLLDRAAVDAFFAAEAPDHVVLAAAKVGGILANDTYRGDFIYQNLMIQTNVIDAAYRAGVKRFLFLGSSCIYPKMAPQPIPEDALLTGPLEPTNLPYAVAKIAGHVMCDSYRHQYGFDAFTVMPSNVYGVGDNFDPDNSHVAAGLMRRIHAAKEARAPQVVAWGTGTPLREMVYCEDLADACVHLLQHYDQGGMINAGSGQEYSIRQIAETVKDVVGYQGDLVWDDTKPDGTPRKIMDNAKLFATGWRPKTELHDGLAEMYRWFRDNVAARAA
jgi:GDP-L-fucose synthase